MPRVHDELKADQLAHSDPILMEHRLRTETERLVEALRTMPNARAPGKRRLLRQRAGPLLRIHALAAFGLLPSMHRLTSRVTLGLIELMREPPTC